MSVSYRFKDTPIAGYVREILSFSSIHGMKYLPRQNLHLIERIFLGAAILASLGWSCYMLTEMCERLVNSPVITTFQHKETGIGGVPFPAVTVCNVNMLKRSAIVEAVERYREVLADGGDTVEMLRVYGTVNYLTQFCLSAESFRRIIRDENMYATLGYPDFVQEVAADAKNFVVNSAWENIPNDYNTEELIKEEYQNIIRSFTHKASHGCEDLLRACLWEGKVVNCERLFTHVHTVYGVCCVFNMMPNSIMRNISLNSSDVTGEMHSKKLTDEEAADWESFGRGDLVVRGRFKRRMYPRRQRSGGKQFGLSFMLNPELKEYSSCSPSDSFGFQITVHSPISFPNVMDYGVAISPNSEVFLNIAPDVTFTGAGLEVVDVSKRGCYFPHDKAAKLDGYKFYSSSNCMDECLARHTRANCSCVWHYMPHNSSMDICDTHEMKCAIQVRGKRLCYSD